MMDSLKTKGRRVAITTGLVALVLLAVAVWLCWPHLVFWYHFEWLGTNPQGYPEYRHRQTGIVMVKLPGGTFWMGAQETNPNGPNYDPESVPNEAPVHEVILSPFLIGKYEVTQSQWRGVIGSNPSTFKGDDQPVEEVSWEDVQEFEKKTCLSLPSEAEWEYACRATTTTAFAGTGNLDDMGWYKENSAKTTHPVGQKAPNRFGLYDMHGSVWEWCEDLFNESFYGKADSTGPDPISREGSKGSEGRIFRGGAWRVNAQHCRSAYRSGANPRTFRDNFLGFRAAYYLLPPEEADRVK